MLNGWQWARVPAKQSLLQKTTGSAPDHLHLARLTELIQIERLARRREMATRALGSVVALCRQVPKILVAIRLHFSRCIYMAYPTGYQESQIIFGQVSNGQWVTRLLW